MFLFQTVEPHMGRDSMLLRNILAGYVRICFVYSYLHSFIRPSIHPSIHPFVRSFLASFLYSFTNSLFYSFTHLLTHSLTHLFIHSTVYHFVHSFIRLLMCALFGRYLHYICKLLSAFCYTALFHVRFTIAYTTLIQFCFVCVFCFILFS